MVLIGGIQVPLTLIEALGLDGVLTPPQTILQNNTLYDYIVVGAGTAGSIVASRLVEDKNNDVLLLEAGPDPLLAVYFAGLFFLLQSSLNDYNYTSAYDGYAARGSGGYTKLTAGKTLGGSASINHLIHTRGAAQDYATWASLTNDPSWEYQNVLQYFIKSENLNDAQILAQFASYHGVNGPTGLTTERSALTQMYFTALAQSGNVQRLDINSYYETGYVQPCYTINNRKRQTPALTYVYPVKDYPNLHYSRNTRVIRVLFEGNTAIGVVAVNNGISYTLRARKEVILSAGVYNTPQLLMLSGIGPPEDLEAVGIPVISNLPVGQNLIDQATVHFVYKTVSSLLPVPSVRVLEVADVTQLLFPIMVGAVPLNKTLVKSPDYNTFCPILAHDTPFLTIVCADVFGLSNEICDKLQAEVASSDSFYCLLPNFKPISRGKVRLASSDPFDDPIITLNYYEDDRDLTNMLTFTKDFLQVGNSRIFRSENAELVGLDIPDCETYGIGSDEYWMCYILNMSTSLYHTYGSNPMGTIVDGNLRVYGFNNLRIVDSSVIPVVSGGPNAAVLMLAEKAADLIKSQN